MVALAAPVAVDAGHEVRRVLFHYPVLNTGGAEMSSLRMMRALADRGWRVTLVLTTGGGNLEPMIDPRVEVVRLRPRAYGTRFACTRGLAARLRALPDLLGYGAMRVVGALRALPFRFRRFDAAAVLLMGTPSHFVRRVVRSGVRAIWVRSDLSGADASGRVVNGLRLAADEIDHFVCVSGVARDSLVAALPESARKAVVIYNIVDPEVIRARAGKGVAPFAPGSASRPVILTVCRLQERSKALLRMVSVCRRLAEQGVDFHWFVAGDGPDRAMFEAAITDQGQGARMTLLGNLENPYPAYLAADLVAMLSRYEGLCGVVNEARILERPLIATKVSGIDEQLRDGVNGLVVENDEDAIVAGMARLLRDPALRARLAAGGYPAALLDDGAKLDRLEALFLGDGELT